MFSLLSACRRLSIYSCLAAFSFFLRAQTPTPEAQEYLITGALPGEQILSRLSLTPQGGYIVWQDNAIDGQGLGVGAQRLDSTGAAVADPFVVNLKAAGDQWGPSVATLNNGNAVVAWQGGPLGFPNLYARVLGPDGGFLTGDIQLGGKPRVTKRQYTSLVSLWEYNRPVRKPITFVKTVRRSRLHDQNATVAGLADGSAVVVYSGIRKNITTETKLIRQVTYPGGRKYIHTTPQRVRTRLDWMHEIYFQRLSPTGEKIGAEVLVNQINTFNQRNPAVAVLNDGNFVVAWVSEEQFARPFPWLSEEPFANTFESRNYIIVRGRLYNQAGEPLGDEFRVDGTDPVICAHPAVAAAADGGFTVVWGQLDRERTNRWDISGRSFSANGAPLTSPFRINTRTYGDQLTPKIAAAGGNQLVVWTSLGQDGSREGVYGQLLAGGVPAGAEFRVNTTTRHTQRYPTVASYDADHFLVAWESFRGLATSFDLMAQRFTAAQPPPAPAAPTVTPSSQESLLVAWAGSSEASLQHYEVYVDGNVTPVIVSSNSLEAAGFAPASTHTFRLAYVLGDRGRSLLSEPASGTTLSNDAPAVAKSAGSGAVVAASIATHSGDALRIDIALTDKGVTLQWNTESGASYQVQMSTNLSSWMDLGSPRSASGVSDYMNIEPGGKARFYRVKRVH